MLCVVTEETERVIGERRLKTLRDVASKLAATKTVDEMLQAIREELHLNRKDLPFTLTYVFDDDGGARLAASSGIEESASSGAAPNPTGMRFPLAGPPDPEPSRAPFDSGPGRTTPRRALAGRRLEQAGGAGRHRTPQSGRARSSRRVSLLPAPIRTGVTVPLTAALSICLPARFPPRLGNAQAYEAERRRAEALAELDRAKTTFFSNVSHELRTPLTLMLSPVEELLSADRPHSPEDRELLELVHRNGLRLQKLVNSLLEFSRIEAGRIQANYEPIDLARFTEELASTFRSAMESAGLIFTIDCVPLPQAGLCGPRHVGENRPESSFECPEVHVRRRRQCCAEGGWPSLHS